MKGRAIGAFVICLLLAGCSFKPLKPVVYDQPTTVTTGKTASIRRTAGVIGGSSPTGVVAVESGVYVPIETGEVEAGYFGQTDQDIFVQSLGSELVRHGIFRSVLTGPAEKSATDVRISIVFISTYHNPDLQEYTLDVGVRMQSSHAMSAGRYYIRSSEGDSLWAKMNTSGNEGKSKAADKLMKALIPAIERFLAKSPAEPALP